MFLKDVIIYNYLFFYLIFNVLWKNNLLIHIYTLILGFKFNVIISFYTLKISKIKY